MDQSSLPWVFIDVDGTLQMPRRPVSSANIAAMRMYLEKGGRISFATGKHPHSIEGLLADFPETGPHIVLNGGVIVAPDGSRQVALIDDHAAALEKFLRANRIEHVAYFLDALFSPPSLIGKKNLTLLASFNEPVPRITDDWPKTGMIKILSFVPASDEKLEQRFRAEAGAQGVKAVRTTDHFLEFIALGSGKETAMRTILEESKWPIVNTAAIGDSENDLGMLHASGRSFAVANATDAVRTAVDYVVASCDGDGVAEALNGLANGKFDRK